MADSKPQKSVQHAGKKFITLLTQGAAHSALIFMKISFAELQQAETSTLNFTQIDQEICKFSWSWLDSPSGQGLLRIRDHTQKHRIALDE